MTEEIRKQVEAKLSSSGMSKYQLAKTVGIEPSNIYRLFKKDGSGSIPELWEKIFEALNLELKVVTKGGE